MKRKLFSAILFGALLATSTSGLTSCKDYDDDITNLQGQIDKLATKEELSTKANELANSISAAQQSATAAKETADKALAAAQGASTDAKAAADAAKAAQAKADEVAGDLKDAVENAAKQIQEAVKDLATRQEVADAVKEVKDKYDAQAKDLKALSDRLAKVEAKLGMGEGGEDIDLTEIQAELEDIEDAFEALVGVVSDMVTSVELVLNSAHNTANNLLNFNVITEKKNETFGKDVADKVLTTVKDHTVFGSADVLIRVNPVDAEISKEDISLINSKGEELTGLVEATKVERYSNKNYLTRAAGANTGLWKVTFAPVDGKKADDLKKKFVVDQSTGYGSGNYIVYGVAVKSAISDSISADRRVVSAYDVAMKTTPYTPTISKVADHAYSSANLNDITITTSSTKESIDDLYNRYDTSEGTELVWNSKDPAVTPVKPGSGANTKLGDNRNNETTKKKVVARVGEDIEIEFEKKIKGFYVTLDTAFAQTFSSPSEINAWDGYKYENVGKYDTPATMFEGSEGTIKVSELSHNVTGDEIGFRIYAMNEDGTLVDPDGVAFYVVVGEVAGSDINLGTQNILVTKAAGAQGFDTTLGAGDNVVAGNLSAEVALPTDAFKGFTKGTITCVNVANSDDKRSVDTDYQILYKVGNNWQTTFAATAKAVKVQILQATEFVDGATYKITLPLQKTASGQAYTVKNAVINITKEMPSSCPTFIWKTNQTELQALVPADNNYAVSSSAKDGILNFNNMFVVADGSQINADHSYVFRLAGSEVNTSDNDKTVDLYRAYGSQYYFNGTTQTTHATAGFTKYEAYIANKFIDGTTPHALTTEYNYGKITSEKDANANFIDYKLSSSNYNLTYTTWSIQSADYMTYAWKKVNIGTGSAPNNQPMNFINTAAAPNPTIKIANILATNGQMINGDLRQPDLNTYVETKGYLVVDKVETKSNTNYSITNEYYTPSYAGGVITFTLRNTGNTVPDHTAKVQITVKDCFGHKEVIELTAEFKAISGANAQLASN